MYQSQKSNSTVNKNIQSKYKWNNNIFNTSLFLFVIISVITLSFLVWGIQSVNYNNKDWQVKKFMLSTQDAIENYYKQNNKYPNDLRSLAINHTGNLETTVSSNQVIYLNYKINYILIDNNNYKLETYFKGPRNNGKYTLSKNTR